MNHIAHPIVRSKRGFPARRVVLCAAAIILAAGSTAFGQQRQRGGGFGFLGGQQQAISSADIERYSRMLDLTGEQRDVVDLLFANYEEEHEASMQALRDEMQSMREGGGGFEGMRERMSELTQNRRKLQEAMLGDIHSILNPSQESAWPRVERAVRRTQGLRQGTLSGERVDIVRVVDDLELDAAGINRIDSILIEYEMAIDSAIARRDKEREGLRDRARDSGDPQAAFEQMRTASERVRDVNRRYARQIESSLEGDSGARFAQSFRRASYPQVYRPGRGQRAIEATLGFEDLTLEQRSAIESIQADHTRDASALNETHVAVIDEAERSGTFGNRRRGRDAAGGPGRRGGGDREARQGRRPGQGEGDRPGQGRRPGQGEGDRPGRSFGGRDSGPGAEIAQQKRELDTRTLQRVQDILNESQAGRLDELLRASRERGEGARRGPRRDR